MKPTPVAVAVRAYTVPCDAAKQDAPTVASRPSASASDPPWPKYVLVFDTETTTDASQRLTFGSYRVCKWTPTGALALIEAGLFYADELPRRDAAGFAELARFADAHRIELRSRTDFMDDVFKRVALDMRGMVVGFNLPFDLSRLALSWGEARGRYRGGFSFVLWYRRGKRAEHPFRPRVCVRSLDSKRALIGFTRPKKSNESRRRTFRGHFLDLRTLAFALTAEAHSLAGACKAFGVTHGKLATEEHGRITPGYIEYACRDVLATAELLEKLRVEFDRHELPLTPVKALSPASIGKAYLRALGIRPPQEKAPDIGPAQLGRVMGAYFGGRAECAVRRVPVPVVTVDFRSMYPTVNCLMQLWGILTAAEIALVDYTAEFQTILDRASIDGAFDPALWPQLACFAELVPDGDILPVRARYAEGRDSWNIGVNMFTASGAFTYGGPDLYASALLTKKTPRIRRAWRLVGTGQQDGLQPVRVAGAIPVEPRTMDLFRTLIEERLRVKRCEDRPAHERDRIAQALKIFANSGSYGIFAEMNRKELPVDETALVTVYGQGEPFTQKTRAPESDGVFCFPPLAALIASAARLMLALLERSVADRGGHYAFCDTDSMAIIATETEGVIPCGAETIRALSWGDVSAIVARFERLNPYDRTALAGSILHIEDANYRDGMQREVFAYVVSAKRYALFSRDASGGLDLIKVSEHGLGHLMNPLPRGSGERWPDVLWRMILCEELGIPYESPAILSLPAVSQVSISTPAYFRGFLRAHASGHYAERIKPFGFAISAQVARFAHPAGIKPTQFHLLAPYSPEATQWARHLWTDTYSGERYGIATAQSCCTHVVRVRSVSDVLGEFLAHGEEKRATRDGVAARSNALGRLHRRDIRACTVCNIGKEANALDAVAAGLISDWRAVLNVYSAESLPAKGLWSDSARILARTFGVSVRTVRVWRKAYRDEANSRTVSSHPRPLVPGQRECASNTIPDAPPPTNAK